MALHQAHSKLQDGMWRLKFCLVARKPEHKHRRKCNTLGETLSLQTLDEVDCTLAVDEDALTFYLAKNLVPT